VGHTITFLNDGGALTADNSGNWQPDVGGAGGSAPANYGGKFQFVGTNYAAIRHLAMGFTANAVPLTRMQPYGTFSFPSTQTVTLANCNFDYRTTVFGSDRQSAAGLSGSNQAGNGSVQANGDGTLTLTVPVDADILVYDLGNGDGAWIHFNGTLVGTGTLGTNPAVGSFQVSRGQAIGSDPLTGTLARPAGVASGDLSSAAAAEVMLSQVQESRLDGAVATHAHATQSTALEVVFQDPLLNTGLSS